MDTVFESYELVMLTRHAISLDDAKNKKSAFGRAHHSIIALLDGLSRYCAEATLNPNDTSQLGGKCLLFDAYGNDGKPAELGMLAVIKVFRAIAKLKEAGHSPYSDMDRAPVVERKGFGAKLRPW